MHMCFIVSGQKNEEKKMPAPNRIPYGCYKANDWRS